MASTGGFLAAIKTGIKVAKILTKIAIPKIIKMFKILKFNIFILIKELAIEVFKKAQKIAAKIVAKVKHNKAIIPDSDQNTIKTSPLFAPTALKIPISFFLLLIDADIIVLILNIIHLITSTYQYFEGL